MLKLCCNDSQHCYLVLVCVFMCVRQVGFDDTMVPPAFAERVHRATAGTPRLVLHCIRMLRFRIGRRLLDDRTADAILLHVYHVVQKIMPHDLFCENWSNVGTRANRGFVQSAYRAVLLKAVFKTSVKEDELLFGDVSYAKVKRCFAVFDVETPAGSGNKMILVPEFSLWAAADADDGELSDIVALVQCTENVAVHAGWLFERMACRRMEQIARFHGKAATMGDALPFLQGTAVAGIPFPCNMQFCRMPTVTSQAGVPVRGRGGAGKVDLSLTSIHPDSLVGCLDTVTMSSYVYPKSFTSGSADAFIVLFDERSESRHYIQLQYKSGKSQLATVSQIVSETEKFFHRDGGVDVGVILCQFGLGAELGALFPEGVPLVLPPGQWRLLNGGPGVNCLASLGEPSRIILGGKLLSVAKRTERGRGGLGPHIELGDKPYVVQGTEAGDQSLGSFRVSRKLRLMEVPEGLEVCVAQLDHVKAFFGPACMKAIAILQAAQQNPGTELSYVQKVTLRDALRTKSELKF